MSNPIRSVFPLHVLPFIFFPLLLVLTFAGCSETSNDAEMSKESTQDVSFVSAEGASPHVYDILMLSKQQMTQDGETRDQELQGSGSMTLTQGTSAADGVLWKSVSDMKLAVLQNGEAIGEQPQKQEVIYTVSPEGKVVDLQMVGMDNQVGAELQQLMQRSAGGQTGMQMFLQKDWLNKTVGETWSDNMLDTVQVDSVATSNKSRTESVYLVLDIKTDYTYEGEVDTLGCKAARISYTIKEINMQGRVGADGNEMTIKSQGSGSGVFYYDTSNYLQVAARTRTNIEMLIGMPSADKYMPINQQMTLTMTRKAKG